MKVTLLDYTGKGAMKNGGPLLGLANDADYAIDLLIFTKSTRLTMHPGLLDEIKDWPLDKKMEELKYMANTIPSSWEFVDYTFMVEGVTRAFTHQFVRSRQFSFAQQTMRVLDVSEGAGWDYLAGPTVKEEGDPIAGPGIIYKNMMKNIGDAYKLMIGRGAKVEDARGLLPTNILTNIVGKCNMRTFVELVRKRSSPRTQNEYRDVLDAMKAAVREVHPWIDLFIERDIDKAIADLQEKINRLRELPNFNQDEVTQMTKLLDQIRAQS